jgi:hypothetical protein
MKEFEVVESTPLVSHIVLMKSLRLALLSGALIGAGPALAVDAIVVAGKTCPANTTPVTYDEAVASQSDLCHKMGPWFIARLAGGGSLDGPGYDCRMRPNDTRDLGHILCKTAAAGPAPGAITGVGCTRRGVESSCIAVAADAGGAYDIGAASPRPDLGRRISFSGTRRTGGAGFCEGTPLVNITWTYVTTGPACPPVGPL